MSQLQAVLFVPNQNFSVISSLPSSFHIALLSEQLP
jgi:hypothetical protein